MANPLREALLGLLTETDIEDNIREFPPRDPTFSEIDPRLHADVYSSFRKAGIKGYYTHQALAIQYALDGKNVVTVTGTNSGKTIGYAAPVFHALASEPSATALLLFPTKALAQDQTDRLQRLSPTPSIRLGTYDGDTERSQRATIRRAAHVVLTNPDMLHLGILPRHETWVRFLKSLRVIVLDEVHTYRGVFGSHVANVIRRLLRICEGYGSRPQILASSATVEDPARFMEELTGLPFTEVNVNSAPSGLRTFAFLSAQQEFEPVSANVKSAELMVGLAEQGYRSLVFSRSRIGAELVLKLGRQFASRSTLVSPDQFESYRAGYTIAERRAIEKALFQGEIFGLSATNALELGVDIGKLDVVILNGYPGSISSFRQQSGRAGRGIWDSLVVFVAHDDPLDALICQEPDFVLSSKPESITINPQNPQILGSHLACAAHEKPLSRQDLERFGLEESEIAMQRSGELVPQGDKFYWPGYDSPASKVSLRSADSESISLMLNGETLGSMEKWRALQQAHAGAVYLHRGNPFLVDHLDLENRVARLVRFEGAYYTRSMVQSVIEPLVQIDSKYAGDVRVSLGSVRVTSDVAGYKKIALEGSQTIDFVELMLPSSTKETLAVRFDFSDLMDADEESGGAIHAFEHAVAATASLFCGADRGDIGSAWYVAASDTLQPSVFLFDQVPGGIGLTESLFSHVEEWIRTSYSLLRECGCDAGCGRCLLSSRCESANELLSKGGAIHLFETHLKSLLEPVEGNLPSSS